MLRGLELDPDAPGEIQSPGPRDVILCGCPRTGTSLLAAALHQPPHSVIVMEPWDALRMPPAELFASLRQEIAAGPLRRGRLDLDVLDRERSVAWCSDGERARTFAVAPDYVLGVKFTGLWRYIDRLPDTRFLVCVRDPVETIASFRDAGGRVAQGLQYDITFNRQLNRELEEATDDVALRRVLLYDHIHERLLPMLDRPNVTVVRYERWGEEAESLLRELGDAIGVELGPLGVDIRPPRLPVMSRTELDLIRAQCRTAGALGYDLG